MTTITIPIDGNLYTCAVDLNVIPGEPMVRYYSDGSGYPGSDAEVEVLGCEVLEAEFNNGGDPNDPDNWNYRERADFGDEFDALCLDELQSGSYDDELLEDADYDDGEF